MVGSLRIADDAWSRLPWLLPLGAALALLSLMGLLRLFSQMPAASHHAPIEVEVVEPPPAPVGRPPAAVVRATPPPPPRHVDASSPPPRAIHVAPPAMPRPPEPVPPREEAPAPPSETPVVTPPPIAAPPSHESSAAPSPLPPATTPVAPPREAPPPAPSIAAVPPGSTTPATTNGRGFGGGRMGARAIYKPLPAIPESLRHRDIDTVAVARFRVAANGTAEVELSRTTPDPELNRAVLDALRRWRFFPGTENGKPVESTVEIRIPITVR